MISYTLRHPLYSQIDAWKNNHYADYLETHTRPVHATKSLNYNKSNANRRWDSEANNGGRGMPEARLSFPKPTLLTTTSAREY